MKNAQWKIAHLGSEFVEGLRVLHTATRDKPCLMSEVAFLEAVIKAGS